MAGDTYVESGHSAKNCEFFAERTNWICKGCTVSSDKFLNLDSPEVRALKIEMKQNHILLSENLQSNSSYTSKVTGSPILTGGTVKSVYQTAALVNSGRNNSHKVGVMLKLKDTSISNDYVLNELKKNLNPADLRISINGIRNGIIVNCGNNESLKTLEKSVRNKLGTKCTVEKIKLMISNVRGTEDCSDEVILEDIKIQK
ncbi:hypothetical protein WA026_016822 [Henosepilachna vigintioctopunctata]|uniref:Uncharacterized protein n=1 Tax=Henosepilachna vigintioctopunctata TaxID=420089 RepID=A0AAW1V2N1_9CUCU